MTTLYVNPASTAWSTMTLTNVEGNRATGPYTLGPGDVAAGDTVDLNGAGDGSSGEFDIDQTGGVTCAAIIDSTRTGLDFAVLTVHNVKPIHADVGNNTADSALSNAKIVLHYADATGVFTLTGAFLSGIFEAPAVNFSAGTGTVRFQGAIHGSVASPLYTTYIKWTGAVTQPANCIAGISAADTTGFIDITSLTLSNYGIVSMSCLAGKDIQCGTAGTRATVANMSANAQFAFTNRPHDSAGFTPLFTPWALPANEVLYGVNRYDGTGTTSGSGTLGTVTLPNTDGSTPDASVVKSTAHFGAGNATAGTLDMSTYTLISTVVAAADVRHGTARYSGGSNGSAYIPAAGDVRYGTSVDATTGTCHVPTAAQTLYGVSVETTTGTFSVPNSGTPTGTADTTSDSLVVSGSHYGATNARTGTASGGGLTVDDVQAITQSVLGRTRWHVAKTGNDSTGDGKSYATAKSTIAGAIAVAGQGDEIVVWPNATAYAAHSDLSALTAVKLTIMPGATLSSSTSNYSVVTVGEAAEVTGGGTMIRTGAGSHQQCIYGSGKNDVHVHGLVLTAPDVPVFIEGAHTGTHIHDCRVNGAETAISITNCAEYSVHDNFATVAGWSSCAATVILCGALDTLPSSGSICNNVIVGSKAGTDPIIGISVSNGATTIEGNSISVTGTGVQNAIGVYCSGNGISTVPSEASVVANKFSVVAASGNAYDLQVEAGGVIVHDGIAQTTNVADTGSITADIISTIGTAGAGLTAVQLAAIDGVSSSRVLRALLAFAAGKIGSTDNGATVTLSLKAQDTTTEALSITYNKTTGLITSSSIGA